MIAGIVTVPTAVIGAGLCAATASNVLTWRLRLPSRSGHALVGAALVEGGADAVRWGCLDGAHPVGVVVARSLRFGSSMAPRRRSANAR